MSAYTEKINLVRDLAERASMSLFGSFIWSETNEGFSYWDDVYTKLVRMVEEADGN